MSFDEWGNTLATLAVESFERLGVEGGAFTAQLAASVVGGVDGRSMARKEVLKARLLQLVSVITQVAVSRRVSPIKFLPGSRGGKKESGRGGDDRCTPMAWGRSLDAA